MTGPTTPARAAAGSRRLRPITLKLGNATEPRGSPTVYASWEDELEEFWRRLSELSGSAAPWVTPERLSRLHIADMAGHGPLWGPRADGGRHTDTLGETTAAGHELRRLCEEVGARLLIVDPSAAAYGSTRTAGRWYGPSCRTLTPGPETTTAPS